VMRVTARAIERWRTSCGCCACTARPSLRQQNGRLNGVAGVGFDFITRSIRFSFYRGSPDEFDEAMRASRDIYMAWCNSSLSGGVRANREHHTQWLLSQLVECAQVCAFKGYCKRGYSVLILSSHRRSMRCPPLPRGI
jgi:hypothetical protein